MFSQVKAISDVVSVVKNCDRGSWNTLPTVEVISSTVMPRMSLPLSFRLPVSFPPKKRGSGSR